MAAASVSHSRASPLRHRPSPVASSSQHHRMTALVSRGQESAALPSLMFAGGPLGAHAFVDGASVRRPSSPPQVTGYQPNVSNTPGAVPAAYPAACASSLCAAGLQRHTSTSTAFPTPRSRCRGHVARRRTSQPVAGTTHWMCLPRQPAATQPSSSSTATASVRGAAVGCRTRLHAACSVPPGAACV